MDQNPWAAGQQFDDAGTGPSGVDISRSLRIMQIIAGALLVGVLFFLGIVLVTTQGNMNGQPEVLTWLGVGLGMVMIVKHVVLPAAIARTHLKQARANGIDQQPPVEQVNQLCVIFQTQLIISLALLEGAAFLNLIALMLEHSVYSIAIASVMVILMAFRFPTKTRVEFWIENKLRELSLTRD